MDTGGIVVASIIGLVITLWIAYELIRSAVKAAMKEQNALIKKQNDILLMMLNKQGFSKDDLYEIFRKDKGDIWSLMKNETTTI